MVEFVAKLKHCWIGTKSCVIVDFDPMIMVLKPNFCLILLEYQNGCNF